MRPRTKRKCPAQTILTPCELAKKGIRVVYLLVDLDADGALGDVPDATGAAVVELVRHPLVDGAVHLDVDVVADLVGAEVGGERDVALLAEGAREEVARPRAQPVASRHPGCSCLLRAAARAVAAAEAGVGGSARVCQGFGELTAL